MEQSNAILLLTFQSNDYLCFVLGKTITLDDGSTVYEVVVVTDLDHASKHETKKHLWQSYMKMGMITLNNDWTKASVIWQDGKEVFHLAILLFIVISSTEEC